MGIKTKTVSQQIALRVLTVDAVATFCVLGLCARAILRDYEGALPYLTALIGALQVVTGVLLSAYYKKSTIAFLREILNYYHKEKNLDMYLSALSDYNHPKMEGLCEIARV